MRKQAYHFPGFSVLVPEPASGIRVKRKEVRLEAIPGIDEIELVRHIGSFDFLNEEEEVILDLIDLPLEFIVGYTIDDIWKAGCFDSLKLYYWNGEKWTIISKEEHEFRIFPPSTATFAQFKIGSTTGDPTLVWGK